MRSVVRENFIAFTEPFEGAVTWMYLDVKGLVTTAIGNLIDPMPAALSLPWMRPDGTPASLADIRAEWQAVKARTDLAPKGGGIFSTITKLRLTDEGVRRVVLAKLDANDAALTARFPDFQDWPADAQLATHSMAWACGAGFRYPKMAAALLRRDFTTAAAECTINPQIGTIVKRNAANRALYLSAAHVEASGDDPNVLCWP